MATKRRSSRAPRYTPNFAQQAAQGSPTPVTGSVIQAIQTGSPADRRDYYARDQAYGAGLPAQLDTGVFDRIGAAMVARGKLPPAPQYGVVYAAPQLPRGPQPVPHLADVLQSTACVRPAGYNRRTASRGRPAPRDPAAGPTIAIQAGVEQMWAPSVAAVHAAGFARVAKAQVRCGHAIWDIRPALDGEGFALVRKREERLSDFRENVGVGVTAQRRTAQVEPGATGLAEGATYEVTATHLWDEEGNRLEGKFRYDGNDGGGDYAQPLDEDGEPAGPSRVFEPGTLGDALVAGDVTKCGDAGPRDFSMEAQRRTAAGTCPDCGCARHECECDEDDSAVKSARLTRARVTVARRAQVLGLDDVSTAKKILLGAIKSGHPVKDAFAAVERQLQQAQHPDPYGVLMLAGLRMKAEQGGTDVYNLACKKESGSGGAGPDKALDETVEVAASRVARALLRRGSRVRVVRRGQVADAIVIDVSPEGGSHVEVNFDGDAADTLSAVNAVDIVDPPLLDMVDMEMVPMADGDGEVLFDAEPLDEPGGDLDLVEDDALVFDDTDDADDFGVEVY